MTRRQNPKAKAAKIETATVEKAEVETAKVEEVIVETVKVEASTVEVTAGVASAESQVDTAEPAQAATVEHSVEVPLNEGLKKTHQSGDFVVVWSSLPHIYQLEMPVSRRPKTSKGEAVQGGTYANWRDSNEQAPVIRPGANKIAREVWNWAMTHPCVQKRCDYNYFVAYDSAATPPPFIMAKLRDMQEGNAMSKSDVFNLLSERSVKDPANIFTDQIKKQGFVPLDEDTRHNLGSPIIAG